MTDHIFTPGNYTTKDGRPAHVLFRMSEPTDDPEPMIGEVLDENGLWQACWWRPDGTTDGGTEDALVPPTTYLWCTIAREWMRGWTDTPRGTDMSNPDVLGFLRASSDGCRPPLPRIDRPHVVWLTKAEVRAMEANP